MKSFVQKNYKILTMHSFESIKPPNLNNGYAKDDSKRKNAPMSMI